MKQISEKPALLIISGPTASGKSALAETLAAEYQLPVLSADSRQVYRYFDIGTAKPSREIIRKLSYELIDIIEPEEWFSAGKFVRNATELIENKYRELPAVIIAGGTGFYLSALLEGISDIPEITEDIHRTWDDVFEQEGLTGLQLRMKEMDPDFMSKGEFRNPERLLRAAKIYAQTGRSVFSFTPRSALSKKHTVREFSMLWDREALYRRIDLRVDQMIGSGLIAEAEQLLKYRHDPAMRTVGYRELLPYFDGDISLPTAVDKIKQHSRNYAKRQWTWYRKHGERTWIPPEDIGTVKRWLENIL